MQTTACKKLSYKIVVKKIQNIRDLKRLGGREALVFAYKCKSLAAFWDACERADWMSCVLVQGSMLDKKRAVKLASAFAERTPTRMCRLWLIRVRESRSDSDAAGDVWAASYASAHAIAYARGTDFDDFACASEMCWQANKIRKDCWKPIQAWKDRMMDEDSRIPQPVNLPASVAMETLSIRNL